MKRFATLLAAFVLLAGCHHGGSTRNLITAALAKIVGGMTFKDVLELSFGDELAVRDYAAGLLTHWSSSTLGVPDKAPNKRTDIQRIGLARAFLDAPALTAFEQTFPEGHGSLAYRWSAMPGRALQPGFYNFAYMHLRENVPFTEDNRRFQYAFLFDRDGDTSNNYQGQAPYDLDFWNGTDTAFQLVKAPGSAWQFSAVSSRNNNIVPFDTEALLLACDDVLMLMFPQDDIDDLLYCPKCRCTAFESALDYGQNAPHDWFGSLRPERGEFLFGQKWSVIRKVEPQIRLEARFVEADTGYLQGLAIPLEMVASYGAAPGFDFGTKTRVNHDQVLAAGVIGGFADQYSFVPTGLDRGGLGSNLALTASIDYRTFVTQPGPRSFTVDSKDEVPFTASLSLDYKTPWFTGVNASVGDLYGKLGDDALRDQVLGGAGAHVLEAPTLTLYNGQRGLVQIADSTQLLANIESPISDEIQIRYPNATAIETGYTLDVQPFVTNTGGIRMQFRLDTRGVAVRTGEEVTLGTSMYPIDVPLFRHGETLTSGIEVQSGQTLVIGGMQNLGDPNKRGGVPTLQDLPVVNGLFTRRHTDPNKELLLVITPRLIPQSF
ncbi:MAG: hypothetical protein U1F36_11935 [Planctomycetota bacterium]